MFRQKIGQYRLLERLGAGGMGSVYRAVDETLGRDVALKVLDMSMEDSAARLRAEAAALARLSHPAIATVYELVEDDTHLVMVMELVRGQTLQQIVENVGVFSPRRAAALCMQILEALQHAHVSGVVHRDLKPGNLMLTDSGLVKVMDFGIARLEGSVNLTGAGAMLGTPAYMAPEQVLGHPIDARADLYAMGVVFFRLVTGGLPFKGETPFDMAQSQVRDAPAKASDLRADLPEWVDDILARALQKKPVDRFQSAVELHEAFARAISDAPQPVVAPQMEATEVMQRPDFSEATADTDPDQRAIATIEMATVEGVHVPRSRSRLWMIAGVAAVVVAAVWMFDPFNSASTDSASTAAPAVAEAPPQSDSVPPPPSGEPVAREAQPSSSTAAGNAATKVASTAPGRPTSPTPASSESSTGPGLPTASFRDVKVLAVNGSRAVESDVRVHFSSADVSVESLKGETVPTILSYRGIAKATYVHEKDPKWDPSLSGPAGKINVPGILGRSRHWLVLQGADSYLILRLDGNDRLEVMKAFEERARISIERPTNGK